MITIEEMFAQLEAALGGARLGSERLPTGEALGRMLAADQRSTVDLPPFDKSAMDGFAVRADDERDRYRLLETVPAGTAPSLALEPGTATKVMTGAPVPEGTGRVIMQEQTEERDGEVHVLQHAGRPNICPQGEDIQRGARVLPAGACLGALEIANLLACGIAEVEVVLRPRLAVFSTGDELVAAPADLAPGKIVDSNGPLLCGLAAQHGLEVVRRAHLPDDQAVTTEGIRAAMADADLVVLSGGVSVGQFDFVGTALEELGLRVWFSEVAVKPARPVTCAARDGKLVLALPGNPVAVYLMFHLCVRRVVALLSGAPPELREVELPLAGDYSRRKATREQYVPVRVTAGGALEAVELHGSAHLLALMNADGLMRVPAGVATIPAGEVAAFLPLRL